MRKVLVFTLLSGLSAVVPVAPMPTSDQSLDLFAPYTGTGIKFDAGPDACGFTDAASDFIVALSTYRFSLGDQCGQYIFVANTETNLVASGLVHDECKACGTNDLGLSDALFEYISGGPHAGGTNTTISISWNWSP